MTNFHEPFPSCDMASTSRRFIPTTYECPIVSTRGILNSQEHRVSARERSARSINFRHADRDHDDAEDPRVVRRNVEREPLEVPQGLGRRIPRAKLGP